MRLAKNIIGQIWDKVLVMFGVLGVLLPASPWNMPLTYKDSGVFLYIGWRILNGEIPYRDIWDHKPPVIFYINALGLAITNHSRWGVWLVEFAALFLAALIGFNLIKITFGIYSAVFSLLLWLLTLVFVLQGGNLTTEYTLPLQFAALWLIYSTEKHGFSRWHYFLVGVTGAIAFFTKQTSIGVWLAIALYITIRRFTSGEVRQWLREIFFISVGGLIVSAGIAIFLSMQSALPQFWSASFEYNFIYSSSVSGFMKRLRPVLEGITPLTRAGLFQISLIGYVFTILLILYKKSVIREWIPLLSIGLINLPVELILVSTSGEIYPHYYMTMLPVLSLFAGITFWILLTQITTWEIPNPAKSYFLIGVMGILLWSTFNDYQNQFFAYRRVRDETVINYIKDVTSPDDYVLLWGSQPLVNYFAERRSPTRFVYQTPLYKQGYANEEMIKEFLDETIQNRPRLIIDTGSRPFFDFPIHTQPIDEKIAYLQSHYRVVENIDSWIVYEHVDENP